MTVAAEASFVPMQVEKVVGIRTGEAEAFNAIVLTDSTDDRRLVVQVGQREAVALAATLDAVEFGRPTTYELAVGLVEALHGRVRGILADRMIGGAYAATVHLEGPSGPARVDARFSDAVNLAVLTGAAVLVAGDVLAAAETRQAAGSDEARLLHMALSTPALRIVRSDS